MGRIPTKSENISNIKITLLLRGEDKRGRKNSGNIIF